MVEPSGYRTRDPIWKKKKRRLEVEYANHYTNEPNATF